MIFQEFSLVPHLDIAHNIFLGRAPRGRLPGAIDRERLYADARRVLDMIGFDIDPRESVHRLGVAQQQMVEIAKALSQDARILVMDEPTAALVGSRERAAVRDDGAAEGGRRRDRLYLAPHGRSLRTRRPHHRAARRQARAQPARPREATPDELVRLMVGRNVDMTYPRRFREPGATMLEVRGLAAATAASPTST